MSEGRQVLAGEAILSGVATTDRSRNDSSRTDRSREERTENEHGRVETNNAVLEALIREHSRLVYRIAYAVLRRHHDAEDATQETFLRVLRYSRKLAGVADHKTWLARIAWRVAVERNKQRGRKREMPLDDPEQPLPEVASSD